MGLSKAAGRGGPRSRKAASEKITRPAIVLVHGYRGSPLGLCDLAGKFGGYQVYTPAVPPFGGAGELPEYTPQAYAGFLAEWLKRNGIERPVMVGHSMGSIVVAALAAMYPDLINEKVVFMAPIAQKPPRAITNLAPLATVLPNRFIGWLTTRYLFIPRDRELYLQTLNTTRICGADCDSKKGSRGAAKFSSSFAIGDFEISGKKLLFVAGAKDRMNSQKKIKAVAARMGGEVKIIPGAGHLLNYECPDKVAREILAFIR